MSLSLLNRQTTASFYSTPLQLQVDSLVGGFVHQATDWRSLAAMTAGGMAYRAARIGVMGLGSSSAIRVASVGLGLSAEVSAFELTHRSLHSDHPNLWRWSGAGGIRQGLFQSFITFGTLKGAGRIARGENLVIQHLLQDSAMVVGHNVSGAFDPSLKPLGNLAEQFLHAEATNLQIAAGMALALRFAPGMRGLERGLDITLRFDSVGAALRGRPQLTGSPMGLLPLHGQPRTTFAIAENVKSSPRSSAEETPLRPSILHMSGGKDGEGGGKQGPPGRSILSIVFGSDLDRPTPPRNDPQATLDLIRLPVFLEQTTQELSERDRGSPAYEFKRQELHEFLTRIAASPSAIARRLLASSPRKTLARIYDAMNYDSPPLPPDAPDLKIVGRFRPSPEVRELLEEIELRFCYGEEFLSYEVHRREGVGVLLVIDRGRTSLYLRTQTVFRGRPRSSPRSPLHSIPARMARHREEAIPKDLERQVQDAFDRTMRLLPRILDKYTPAPVFKWTLEFWPPSSLPTPIPRDSFRALLQKPLQGLSRVPGIKRVGEIQVELRNRDSTFRFNFMPLTDREGQIQFIPHDPEI